MLTVQMTGGGEGQNYLQRLTRLEVLAAVPGCYRVARSAWGVGRGNGDGSRWGEAGAKAGPGCRRRGCLQPAWRAVRDPEG